MTKDVALGHPVEATSQSKPAPFSTQPMGVAMSEKPDFLPVHRVGEWLGETEVLDAMKAALNEVVEIHGNKAKAICWDVRSSFTRRICATSGGSDEPA